MFMELFWITSGCSADWVGFLRDTSSLGFVGIGKNGKCLVFYFFSSWTVDLRIIDSRGLIFLI